MCLWTFRGLISTRVFFDPLKDSLCGWLARLSSFVVCNDSRAIISWLERCDIKNYLHYLMFISQHDQSLWLCYSSRRLGPRLSGSTTDIRHTAYGGMTTPLSYLWWASSSTFPSCGWGSSIRVIMHFSDILFPDLLPGKHSARFRQEEEGYSVLFLGLRIHDDFVVGRLLFFSAMSSIFPCF